MSAAVLAGLRKMEISSTAVPAIGANHDVLLKTDVVGVCGSDVHYFAEGRIGNQVVKYPFRVGHECSGRVVEVGSSVTRLGPGDRVAVDPAMPCGHCLQCLAGRSHTCTELRFLGCPDQAEGCLAEYIVMPEECCFPIPSNLTQEEAALVEPLSIGIYAVRTSIPLAGKKVGILGCGPIGLSVLLPSLARGAAAAYVTDKIPERLEVARFAGAAWAGNPLFEDIVEEISAQEAGLLDVVFECCGQQDALDQAIDLLAPGGKLMIIGIPSVERVSFSVDDMRKKEISIQNVRRQNGCMQPAIDFMASGHDLKFMMTHHFSLPEAQEAFDLVAGYRDGVVKAMIHL